jgi:hypothetical protein
MGVPESPGKPFDISKRDVWDAWLKVKENQGAPGVDGQSVADFEKDLKNNEVFSADWWPAGFFVLKSAGQQPVGRVAA